MKNYSSLKHFKINSTLILQNRWNKVSSVSFSPCLKMNSCNVKTLISAYRHKMTCNNSTNENLFNFLIILTFSVITLYDFHWYGPWQKLGFFKCIFFTSINSLTFHSCITKHSGTFIAAGNFLMKSPRKMVIPKNWTFL